MSASPPLFNPNPMAGPVPGPSRPKRPWPKLRAILTGSVFGVLYLLAFRGISFFPSFFDDNKGGAILMSTSFIFLGPFVSGMITAYRKPEAEALSVPAWIFAPWIAVAFNVIVALFRHWEGIICVVFILPPALVCASLGGIAAGMWHKHVRQKLSRSTLTCVAALPLILAVVETKIHQPLITRTVHTAATIHAPASVIWDNIKRVRAIAPSELRGSWANTIGFPRPVEATLSREGVGAVRNASFERGLNFIETVTDWQPQRHISFTIRADTAHIPPTTLDEHVTVGGRFFDVLDGEYTIEQRSPNESVLHLTSHQRLSTDFNLYAAMWSDAVMSDMQNNILHVIQQRCEREAAGSQSSTSRDN